MGVAEYLVWDKPMHLVSVCVYKENRRVFSFTGTNKITSKNECSSL